MAVTMVVDEQMCARQSCREFARIQNRRCQSSTRNIRESRPKFALVEAIGKKIIVKINDVGPLTPGRIIDLNERAMRYFDPSLQLGVIHDVIVKPLFGDYWIPGPLG